MTTGVARMWYNHIWLIQLLETTFTSRYCTVPYFKTCNLTNGNWLCYCVSILCRRILTAEKPHRSCKNTVLQKIQHSSHILLIGVLLKSLTSSMVKIALRKLFAGILFCAVVWCCWCWLRSEWGKKTIQTYPYSNCTFHHQNSQRKQTSFTVPTDLGKTLANIICCMCIFQHVGKQDRNHARTNMVKIALRKLFAGSLCGCVVLLVGYEVSDEKKNIQTYPYSNCTFHHQNSQKTNKFYRTNQPRENFGQHNPLHVFLSA